MSPTALHAWTTRSQLCCLFPRRYPSAFSMGCTRRSCFSVMTSRRKTCCSCCARPLRSRRETWWRPCCQVRRGELPLLMLAAVLFHHPLILTNMAENVTLVTTITVLQHRATILLTRDFYPSTLTLVDSH